MKKEFLELPDEEKATFMQKDRKNLDELGMKAITMINCTGFPQKWDYIGIEQWPSIEAIVKREKFEKEELHVSKYVDYKTYLGAPESFTEYGK
jgi:hypothetical protein